MRTGPASPRTATLTLLPAATCVIAAFAAPVTAQAPPEEPLDPFLQLDPLEKPQVIAYAGSDFASKYIARGIVFSDEPSIQPWAELYIPMHDFQANDSFAAEWRFGTWSSIQFADARPAGMTSTSAKRLSSWYELDLYTGLSMRVLDHFTTTLTYSYFHSPADAFADIHEIDWRIAYDDSRHWEESLDGFALNPRLRIAREVYNKAGKERWYIEPALVPSYTFRAFDTYDITASVPLIFGFSPGDGFYQTADGDFRTFGFFQTGARLSMPIPGTDGGSGPLSIYGGVDVLFVRDRAFHGFGKRTDVVGRFGFAWAF